MPTFNQLVISNMAGTLLCFGSLAMAEDDAGIPVGPGYLYPSVVVEERYEDNIFLQDNNEKDSTAKTKKPSAQSCNRGRH